MIKHIVAFKLKNPSDAEAMKAKLMELNGVVDVMRFWEVGINVGPSSQPYEVVIYSVFDSLEDLAIFRDHPKHAAIKQAIAGYIETSGTIDYESDGAS
ncbi:MAG: Dabb family protein [Anaerolinea sp.]|nr:Dabb family protein [Anaerolinea sp.]